MTNGNKQVKVSYKRLKELEEKELRYDNLNQCFKSMERCFKDMMRSRDFWADNCNRIEKELKEFKYEYRHKIFKDSSDSINRILSHYANEITGTFVLELEKVRCGFWGAKIPKWKLAELRRELKDIIVRTIE